MRTINRTTTTNIIATVDRLGGSIPKKAAAEWEKLNVLYDKANNLNPVDNRASAVLAVLEADGDLHSDPAVQRAVTAHEVRDTHGPIAAELDRRVTAFLDTYGSDLLESLRQPFDQAAATITECLDKLGDVALDDSTATLRRGGDAAQIWLDAQVATKAISDIVTTMKLMSPSPLDARYQLLLFADVSPATFIDDQLTGVKLSAWDAARRGYPLSFATPATAKERRDAIIAERQQRAQHAEGAFAREHRRTRGDGGVVVVR